MIGDLRISITDRCNFRCTYCLPEYVDWKLKEEILTYEEITRLVRIFAGLGVRKLRLTGGEPLLRPNLTRLIDQLVGVEGIDDLALTTNGQILARHATPLRAAGLRRLNVSLDSLQPEKFRAMTRRDALGEVLTGIEAATAAGFAPVKINAVIIRGVNDDELVDFARFAASTGHVVRFIEFMPLDSGHRWSREQVVSGREMFETINASIPLIPLEAGHAAETARRYAIEGTAAEIGIISPVTAPFCGNCNRVRLTADGQLRTCLFSVGEHDLKSPMRAGASDEEMADLIVEAVLFKEPGHRINQKDFVQPERTMSGIGG
jgi:GTP 3',8-cyclase